MRQIDLARVLRNEGRMVPHQKAVGRPGITADKSFSSSDVEVVDAIAQLVVAEQTKAMGVAHGRSSSTAKDARTIVENTERMLRLLFQI
jgi:hypothetical protein